MQFNDVLVEPGDDGAESTATLLLRVRSGDRPAREELMGRYMTMLKRWAHGRLPRAARDLVDTDDLVQSTLVRALNRLDHFEPRGEGAFLAYLRQIMLNQIRDESRRAKRRPPHVLIDQADLVEKTRSPLEETLGREQLERYEYALAELGEGQRQAVILRLELGMRYREIADALSVPTANAARALVGRAMVNLARMMRDLDEADG